MIQFKWKRNKWSLLISEKNDNCASKYWCINPICFTALQRTCDSIHQDTSVYSSSSWKGSCGSLGSASTGSLPSIGGYSQGSSSSRSSTSSIDGEVLDLQQRLLWAEGVQPITLATRGRHVIFAGELFIIEEKVTKVVKSISSSNM